MSFPFSVLRAKKEKQIRIFEDNDDSNETKNVKIDFENQLTEIIQKGLHVDNKDIIFITDNINLFYRNNIAVLLLVLNIRRFGDNFITSVYYHGFVEYIARKTFKDDEKKEAFIRKLNFQMQCYNKKIQSIIDNMSNSQL